LSTDLNRLVNKEHYSISETENMFLGAIVGGTIDSEWVLKLRREHIISQNGVKLYDLILKHHLELGWCDFLSLQKSLSETITTAEAKKYLDDLVAKVPFEFNPAKAIEILEETFIRRESTNQINSALTAIQKNPIAAPEILFSVYEKIEGLIDYKVDFSLHKEVDKTIEELITGKIVSVIPTGLKGFDDLTGGFSRKEVTIIAARPNHGKTTTSVSLALSILNKNPNAKVIKFELEMDKESIKRKFLSSLSVVSSYAMRINNLTPDDITKLKVGAEKFKSYDKRLFIYDNVYDLMTMNKIARSVGADMVMVDFITLMDDVEESSMRLSLGRVAKMAKRFAKAHNMSYVFFSQLNRASEFREGGRPSSSDLAESDMLTQLASEIILLWYKFKITQDEKNVNDLFLMFDKARYSSIGDRKFYFNPNYVILKDA